MSSQATMPQSTTQSFALLTSPGEIREGQMYTGMRVRHAKGAGGVWEDVQGRFRLMEPGGVGVGPAVFLERTFPSGQVVLVGMNSRSRTVHVDVNGQWCPVTTLAC